MYQVWLASLVSRPANVVPTHPPDVLSVVSFTAAGGCVIDANQAGNTGYTPATQTTQTIPVAAATPAVALTASPLSGALAGQNVTLTATVTGVTGGPAPDGDVAFTDDGTTIPGCGAVTVQATSPQVSPATATAVCTSSSLPVGSGDSLQASYNSDGNDPNYTTATPTEPLLYAVGQVGQALVFTSQAPAGAVVGGTYTPAAAGGASGEPVTLTVGLGSALVCSIADSGVVSFTAAGSCVIDANQAGNADYAAATQATQTVTVGAGAAPVITAQLGGSGGKNAAGWWHSPVTVTFTCTSPGAGSALTGSCPQPVVLSGSGAGQSVTKTVTASDGQTATVTVTGVNTKNNKK